MVSENQAFSDIATSSRRGDSTTSGEKAGQPEAKILPEGGRPAAIIRAAHTRDVRLDLDGLEVGVTAWAVHDAEVRFIVLGSTSSTIVPFG